MIRLKVKESAQVKAVSMSKLSRMSDVSYDTIQQIYHNPYKDVNMSTLEKLADALNVSVCDLFEKQEGEPKVRKSSKQIAEEGDAYTS